jgi:hypothetical protein
LLIGGLPFKGVTKHVPAAGKYTATIYATTSGYNDPSQIVDHLNVRMLADNKFMCSDVGVWSEDTESTWENIDGTSVKAFKLVIPFEVTEEQDVEFEYSFSWYMVGGATFLDPHPIIESVN